MPSLNQQERGISRFVFLLSLALVAAIVYLVATFAPAYMGNQSMQTAAQEIVSRGTQQNLSDPDIRAQLTEKVREFGLPEEHEIKLTHEGKALAAKISYRHRIRFPFYTYHWPVEINVKDYGL
ncbi:MAG: hypothetical protein ACREEM_50390 [Blastocatellia bacterium]